MQRQMTSEIQANSISSVTVGLAEVVRRYCTMECAQGTNDE